MSFDEFLDLLEDVRSSGSGYSARCPAHEDTRSSLSVTGDDDSFAVKCHVGCTTPDILDALDVSWSDLPGYPVEEDVGRAPIVYTYTDEEGSPLFDAVRFPGKKFRQRHSDPTNDLADSNGWVWNLEGVRRVLYRLPEVLHAVSLGQTIYVCEGEKDADALVERGKCATCNPMGAGKWRKEYSETLAGATVLIVQDKDEPGRIHAQSVRSGLVKLGCTVYIIQAKEGKDAYDHLEAGYAPDEMPVVRERAHRGIITAREMSERAILHLDATPESEPEFYIEELDLRIRNGRLITIGGYTGDGKTNTGLQIGHAVSAKLQAKVGIFTLEMTEEDLRNRLICHWELPLFGVERPWNLSPTQKRIYLDAVEEISSWPLEIIYDTSITSERVDEITRDREYDFIIVDHIHRFSWGHERRKLEEQIQGLNNLALEFNIPVLVLAQLRRYQRDRNAPVYPRPTLQDFRDTEMLGAESSWAGAIWRERDEHGKQRDDGMSEFITLKDRYGQQRGLMVCFDPDTMMFGARPPITHPVLKETDDANWPY